jgi:hypothetical protein
MRRDITIFARGVRNGARLAMDGRQWHAHLVLVTPNVAGDYTTLLGG